MVCYFFLAQPTVTEITSQLSTQSDSSILAQSGSFTSAQFNPHIVLHDLHCLWRDPQKKRKKLATKKKGKYFYFIQ